MNRENDLRPAKERLADFIKCRQAIQFVADADDKEYPYIKLSVWGAIPTNELFIKLSNGVVEFVGVTPSPLIFPGMGDRRFGMDVNDERAAYACAEAVWDKHKGQLILKGNPGR